MSESIDMKTAALELALKPYKKDALGAHMLAVVVDACDSNGDRFQALIMNGIPPEVARRALLAAGYTRVDKCTTCTLEVDQRENVVISFAAKRSARHARCPEAS